MRLRFLIMLLLAPCAGAETKMTCEPKDLTADSRQLTIKFSGPHGRQLSAKHADRYWLLAYAPGSNEYLPAPEPIPGFEHALVLNLDPTTLKGWSYNAGGSRLEHIFTESGIYRFSSANVLETDYWPPEDPLATCTVRFTK